MHGLINRSLECFLRETYGETAWEDIARKAGLQVAGFEAMLTYPDPMTDDVLSAAENLLSKNRNEILEDLGTYLISHPSVNAVRRLLRFGGMNFEEFLHSLDDLPDRARLAVADLDMPRLEIRDTSKDRFSLRITSDYNGFGAVFLGILRAMADDYGALVFLEHQRIAPKIEEIFITVVEDGFAQGRDFSLAMAAS